MRYSVKFLALVISFFVIPCSFVHSFSPKSINACIDKFINGKEIIFKHLVYKSNGKDIVSRRLLFICCEFFRLVEDYCILWSFNEDYTVGNILSTIDDLIGSFEEKYKSNNWKDVTNMVVYKWPNASFMKKLIVSVYKFKDEVKESPKIKSMRKFVNKCINTHLVGRYENICDSICVIISYVLFKINSDQSRIPLEFRDIDIHFNSRGVRLSKTINKQLLTSARNVLKRCRSI